MGFWDVCRPFLLSSSEFCEFSVKFFDQQQKHLFFYLIKKKDKTNETGNYLIKDMRSLLFAPLADLYNNSFCKKFKWKLLYYVSGNGRMVLGGTCLCPWLSPDNLLIPNLEFKLCDGPKILQRLFILYPFDMPSHLLYLS